MLESEFARDNFRGLAILKIRAYDQNDEAEVIALWKRCDLVRSHNDPHKDIACKLNVRSDLFRVGVLDEKIVASVMIGYDGHRGWINYLAVDPDCQRRGFGRQLMEDAERLLLSEGCPKINLQVRHTNLNVLAFYKSLGYVMDEVVSLGKRLEHDEKVTTT